MLGFGDELPTQVIVQVKFLFRKLASSKLSTWMLKYQVYRDED